MLPKRREVFSTRFKRVAIWFKSQRVQHRFTARFKVVLLSGEKLRFKVNPNVFLFEILGARDISKFFNPPIFTIVPCDEILINNFYTFWSSFCTTRFFRIYQIYKKVIMRFIEVLISSWVSYVQVQSLNCLWSLDDFHEDHKNRK